MKPMVAMIAALSLVLAGCAQIYAPAVALEGVDRTQYDADLAQCRSEVAATAPSVPEGFIKGAFLGALGVSPSCLWPAHLAPPTRHSAP